MGRIHPLLLAVVFAGACADDGGTGDVSGDAEAGPDDGTFLDDGAEPDEVAEIPGDVPHDPREDVAEVDVADADGETSCGVGLPPLTLTLVAEGLVAPVFAAGPPGDPTRLFVVEQGGRVLVVRDGELLPEPFLDLSARTAAGGERGLLGLAFHPFWGATGRLWVDYTDLAGHTVIAEYVRSAGEPDRAEPAPVRVLFSVEQPFANHNGGMLAFGPDGYLYVGMGDGGGAGDPLGNAQNLDTRLGKLLRVDVDAYPTPVPGNLTGGDPHIWDSGLRNPWRFSFDRRTGDLYLGDVGQNEWEEINVEPAGAGGRNYGWNVLEGPSCFSPPTGCDPTGMTFPADQYDHTEGCSVVGGYVYRGAAIPCLQGWYLYGDYCAGAVRAFFWDGVAATQPHDATATVDPARVLSRLVSFGEDASGELYVVEPAGRIYRIDPR